MSSESKRKGPGRPPIDPHDRKVTVGVTLSRKTIECVDVIRGTIPRSRWIEAAIEEAIARERRNGRKK